MLQINYFYRAIRIFFTTLSFSGLQGRCWSLSELHMGEGRVHPRTSCQLIAVPCVNIWEFGIAQGYLSSALSSALKVLAHTRTPSMLCQPSLHPCRTHLPVWNLASVSRGDALSRWKFPRVAQHLHPQRLLIIVLQLLRAGLVVFLQYVTDLWRTSEDPLFWLQRRTLLTSTFGCLWNNHLSNSNHSIPSSLPGLPAVGASTDGSPSP